MKKIMVSLVIGLMIVGFSVSAYAHSGRTTTNNPYGITGHTNHSTGTWHSHY